MTLISTWRMLLVQVNLFKSITLHICSYVQYTSVNDPVCFCTTHLLKFLTLTLPCQTLNPNQKNLLFLLQNLEEVSFQLISCLIISCSVLNPLCLHPTNAICGCLFTGDFELDLSDAFGPGKHISPLSFQKQRF